MYFTEACARVHSKQLLSLNPVLRQADASGALEAVKSAVSALPQDRVALRFLLAAASDITASDVDLAFASEGIILGFNQEPSDAVQAHAKQLGAAPIDLGPRVWGPSDCMPRQLRWPWHGW